jgi:rod shape-determining protein MreB
MVREAGASSVCLVPSSACLAFASGLPVLESAGLAVVDLGHGLLQASVYSRGSAILHLQEACGGQDLTQRLREHFRRRHWLAVGETELFRVLATLRCVAPSPSSGQEEEWIEIRGQDLQSGLPRVLTVASWELNRLLELSLLPLQRMLSRMVEDLPPEILHQILQQGVFLAGGLSQLHGLASYLEQHLALPVRILPQAELAVSFGLQGFLQQSQLLQILLASGMGAGRFV